MSMGVRYGRIGYTGTTSKVVHAVDWASDVFDAPSGEARCGARAWLYQRGTPASATQGRPCDECFPKGDAGG